MTSGEEMLGVGGDCRSLVLRCLGAAARGQLITNTPSSPRASTIEGNGNTKPLTSGRGIGRVYLSQNGRLCDGVCFFLFFSCDSV